MAVPNTTTFTLQNVCTELSLTGSAANLSNCFTVANSTYFNPTYAGSKNSLLNFRDYGIHNATLTVDYDFLQFTGFPVNVCVSSTVTVTTFSTNSWVAIPDSIWITVTGGSGTGNGSFGVSVSVYKLYFGGRLGSITISSSVADVVVEVSQITGSACI